jgi:hypothetical protein
MAKKSHLDLEQGYGVAPRMYNDPIIVEKPTGPTPGSKPVSGLRRKESGEGRQHADPKWRNLPEHKQAQKVKSKLSAEPKVPGPPEPHLARGPGYDGSKGYTKVG